MPPLPEYKSWITAGNVLQIGAVIVALSIGWAVMDARSQAATAAIADHEDRIRTLERDVISGLARIEQRLIQLEQLIPYGRNPP